MRFLPERLVFERVLASGGFAQCFITVPSQFLLNPLINCNWDFKWSHIFWRLLSSCDIRSDRAGPEEAAADVSWEILVRPHCCSSAARRHTDTKAAARERVNRFPMQRLLFPISEAVAGPRGAESSCSAWHLTSSLGRVTHG